MSTLARVKQLGSYDTPQVIPIDPSTYRSELNDMFFIGGGVEYRFSYVGHASSLTAYTKCPPLAAIINRKAQAHINGKTWVMTATGKGKGKESQSEVANKIRKLFSKPNPLQSWKQFDAQRKIYIQLFGFCICLPIIPAGFEKYGPIEATSWWNIPPYMIDVKETNKIFYQTDLSGIVEKITLNYRNQQTDLPLKNLGIFKDFTPSFNTMILPESRVVSLGMPINNIIVALESENEVISYAGSQGIITPDTGTGQYVPLPMKDEDKKQLQYDFKRQYGIRRGQFRYIISPAAIKWQSMGTDLKKLMLRDVITENTKSICDSYGHPPHLLGLIDPTFNNQAAAEKAFYQNTIIPEADSECEETNNWLRTSEYNLDIQKDFSHLPILQEDREAMGRARMYLNQALLIEWQNNLITANEWREAIGADTITGWDIYYSDWIKEGKTFGNNSTPAQNIQTLQNNNNGNQ